MIVVLGDLMLDVTLKTDDGPAEGGHRHVQARVAAGGSAANFAVWELG
jgi:sugar/nucleoside kinase (ribokinase family)